MFIVVHLVESGADAETACVLVLLGQMVGIFGGFFDPEDYQGSTRYDYYVDRVRITL
jgi:hypothetical protein